MHALLDGWGPDRGCRRADRPINRNFYDRLRTLDRLRTFLGNADAARVIKADVVRWKQSMQEAGRHISTIRDDLSEMSAVWTWGISNGLLHTAENPFGGVSPRKAPTKKRHVRAFTADEARTILTTSRSETGFLRLLPWVFCLTGARVNEVMQATKEDVTSLNGVAVIRIHDEGLRRSVKNKDSRRAVSIHPGLAAEGFLSYVPSLPAQSPLWPDVLFGQRSTTAGKKLGIWLRGLRIIDPSVSPAHSWRHWFVDACRGVQMPAEVRSALTGHSAKMDESAAYGTAMGSFSGVLGKAMASGPARVS